MGQKRLEERQKWLVCKKRRKQKLKGWEESVWGVALFPAPLHISVFLKKYLLIFRESGREGERDEEKHHCVVASRKPTTGDLAHNPGMGPDWESNQWPFGLQAGAQSTEPRQPGLLFFFYCISLHYILAPL